MPTINQVFDGGWYAIVHTKLTLQMLRVDRLPEVLRSVLGDGVRGAVLMTGDGAALSSCLLPTPGSAAAHDGVSETNLCAISSSIWNNMKQGTNLRPLEFFYSRW